MRTCSAYRCTNNDIKPECAGKSFFKFPMKSIDILKVWQLNISRNNFVPNKNSLLCSDHFTEDCFRYENFTNRRLLEPGAIPTIFLHKQEPESRQIIRTQTASLFAPSASSGIIKLSIKKETSFTSLKMEVGKVEIKVEQENEEKIEVDHVKQEPSLETDATLEGNIVSESDVKKEDGPLVKIIPKVPGEAYITVDELVVEEDESIKMTAEDIRKYIEKTVFDQIVNNNPMVVLSQHTEDVHAEIREKRNEFQKLVKLIDMIERDQFKFLRTDKALRKYLTKTGGVGVDLPVLANSLPDESIIKRGLFPQTPSPTSSKPAPAKPTASMFATKPAPASASKPAPASATKSAPAAAKAAVAPADKTQKPGGDIECIDLTDEIETPKKGPSSYASLQGLVKHPAPLPPKPFSVPNASLPPIPPKPRLKISSEERGIVLQWDMLPNAGATTYAALQSFDIFGYQEQKNIPINTLLWKKIGSVKAMTLPMACTLTQFIHGNKYHFSIRAVDMHNRCGFYSDPISVVYNQAKS